MVSQIRWVALWLLVGLIALPLVPAVLWSLAGYWSWPDLWPPSVNLRAWIYVFSGSAGTWSAIANSLWVAGTVTALNLVLALPAANALARIGFRGKWLAEGVLFAPLVIPPFVAIMGFQMTFIRLGLTETLAGLVLAHMVPTLPYMVRALMVSYATLGIQWEEQASTLGAGRWQRFRYVVLPHLLPGMVAGAGLSLLVSLSQYLITYLIGGGQVITLPLLLFPFISGGDQAIGAVYILMFAGMAAGALWGTSWLLERYYGQRVDVASRFFTESGIRNKTSIPLSRRHME